MSEYAWGDTWPDGSEIERPIKDMLVRWHNGDWGVLDLISAVQVWADLTLASPLAPAPTPGGLWAALLLLGAIEPRYLLPTIRIPHGGEMYTLAFNDAKHFLLEADRHIWKPDHLPLLDTARQHHGTLLAYCAQPGWEAK